jgi:hypothetical protein
VTGKPVSGAGTRSGVGAGVAVESGVGLGVEVGTEVAVGAVVTTGVGVETAACGLGAGEFPSEVAATAIASTDAPTRPIAPAVVVRFT